MNRDGLTFESRWLQVAEEYKYQTLANKILKRRPTRPIVVFVEMPAVEKALSQKKKNGYQSYSDDGDGNGPGHCRDEGKDSDSDENTMGLTKIDCELAHFCHMLEKKYALDHSGGYAYINLVTSTTTPLTPFMMKEWARAMYDGVTTVNDPPKTTTFDPANRKSSLGPHNQAPSSVSTLSSGSSMEVSALSAVSNIFSTFATILRPDHTMPATPELSNQLASLTVVDAHPMIFNTPSKLACFLQATENNGILGVQSYHTPFLLKGYGPDIMHSVAMTRLTMSQLTRLRLLLSCDPTGHTGDRSLYGVSALQNLDRGTGTAEFKMGG
ncbi:hypothetical protein EDB83DRAFT_2309558 [Lactarius deliciosus]|nr:hypothetical protein EDB83DRAFT_2309558 [Lactarius deliciosus]